MAIYENEFLLHQNSDASSCEQEWLQKLLNKGILLGQSTIISGCPRICFTLARDTQDYAKDAQEKKLNLREFAGSIRLGDKCYLESTDSPAFHNQSVKLTCVKRNNLAPGKITIGDRVQLQGTAIVAYDNITIGDDVIFGPMVTIMDCSGHSLTDRKGPHEISQLKAAPVTIGNNAWIGANTIILRGVQIGENAVIGAGSVVYDSVPANCITLGNPAKIVKQLTSNYDFFL